MNAEFINKSTGEFEKLPEHLIPVQKEGVHKYKIGWCRVYANELNKLHEEVIDSKLDLKMLNYIQSMISKEDFTLKINVSKLAKDLGVGRETVSRFVSSLKKADYLRGEKSPYKVNPFVVVPFRTKSKVISEVQNDW